MKQLLQFHVIKAI